MKKLSEATVKGLPVWNRCSAVVDLWFFFNVKSAWREDVTLKIVEGLVGVKKTTMGMEVGTVMDKMDWRYEYWICWM